MTNATITSSAFAVPDREIPNAYFDEKLGTEVSGWLEKNVEIYSRRWLSEGESVLDLVESAARAAIEGAGLAPEDLDLVIVATDTPEFISPSTAATLCGVLETNAGSMDLNAACSGFVVGMDVASKYLRGAPEDYEHVLVVGAYGMSRHLNMEDKKTVTLFADGAGAVVMSGTDEPGKGFLASEMETQGEYAEWMGIYGGGARQPVDQKVLDEKAHKLRFVKKFPSELNPNTWSRLIRDVAAKADLEPEDFDRFFITQININSIRETLDILGLEHERAHTVMHDYGYTGSACIPMAFADAVEKGLVEPGQRVMFVGSGGGLSFAAAAFQL